jgi:hypothetical protein
MSATDPALAGSSETHPSLGTRIVRFLKQPASLFDRRSRKRLAEPPLRAYLGMIGSAAPYPVANISSTGFFMLSDEQWQPGTCLPLRLERTDRPGFAAITRMAVQTCVARKDSKGIGFLFLPINEPDQQMELTDHPQGELDSTRWADQRAIDGLIRELRALQTAS